VAGELKQPRAAVLFALRREAAPFLRLLRRSHLRDEILVEVTGVGAESARACLERLLASATPQLVIAAGYAGALRPGLHVGDVVIASEVIDESGRTWPTTWPAERRGRVLTCSRMIGDPEQKRELGTRHFADAVDMESAALAEVCRGKGIPFACVRAVSDDVTTALSPRLLRLLQGGHVSPLRVCGQLLRAPRLLPELVRLGRNTRVAGARLAERLAEVLKLNQGPRRV
jgi:adenosylhomocysteine nucleosidase